MPKALVKHAAAKPPHAVQVPAAGGVHDAPRAEKEQRLEQAVVQQVEERAGHAQKGQDIAYNIGSGQQMQLGDQIGSLNLVGYIGTSGGHLVS